MIPNFIKTSKRILGSSLSLPAYGWVGQGQHSLAAHFAKRNTKNCGGEKIGIEKRGWAKIPSPPTPFLFARPSGKVFVLAERSSAIKFRSPDFRQKKFGFRPTNTTRYKKQRKFFLCFLKRQNYFMPLGFLPDQFGLFTKNNVQAGLKTVQINHCQRRVMIGD